MKKLLFVFSLMFSGLLMAQTDVFEQGNKAYQAGNYEQAVKLYDSILNTGVASDALYYNLANAHYKLNNLSDGVYYYEKALQVNPSHQDAQVNLAFAKRSLIDVIEPLPKTFLQKINQQFISVFTVDTWAYITIAFITLIVVFALLFFFSTVSGRKKLYFSLGLFFTVLFVAGFLITNHQYQKEKNTQFGVVFEQSIEVKNEPNNKASEVFTLHEGTKVEVLDKVSTWYKVKIADGQIGWLDQAAVKVL